MKQLAILASGGGSNAAAIMEYFHEHPSIRVALALSNKQDAGVLHKAEAKGVPTFVFDRATLRDPEIMLPLLQAHQIDWLILAGFLWLLPAYLAETFEGRVLNIHPALLPKYGGKGMYGHHVHEAVHAAQEPISGCTIHQVNAHYDEGAIVFQAATRLSPSDTPEAIAAKVLQLEHRFFAPVIEALIQDKPLPNAPTL